MPWYKSGTVSVAQNSNAVIGTGTAFLANGRVGDAFRGPDGAWYEVINIASDTAMSIAPPYQGASNAAGIYALAPMQGYVKDSADALRALVNTYGQKLAELGTTGNYEVLPVLKGGTGGATQAEAQSGLGLVPQAATTDKTAGRLLVVGAFGRNGTNGIPQASTVDANTLTVQGRYTFASGGLSLPEATCHIEHNPHNVVGYASQWAEGLSTNNVFHRTQVAGTWGGWEPIARGGANSSITSLTGLTTALSIEQGGTGGKTPADARNALGLKRAAVADILGSVSQAAGVPSGAIFENGTNSQGGFLKLADGTMICTSAGISIGTASIGSNTSTQVTLTMPATFQGSFVIYASVGASSSNDHYGVTNANFASATTANIIIRNGATAQSFVVRYIAIGRWF